MNDEEREREFDEERIRELLEQGVKSAEELERSLDEVFNPHPSELTLVLR